MDTALTFEELKQQTVLPRQVFGLAAALLAGAAITPVNMPAIQGDFSNMTVQTTMTSETEAIPVNNQNLKIMELSSGSDVFYCANIRNISVIEAKKEAIMLSDNIIAASLSWQGVAYKHGGTSREGVDCSALVQAVFRKNGIELSRSSYHQFREGVGIPKDNLKPGDLLFFNTNGMLASHVGIYLGDNQFISATKNCVEIQNLNMPYWAKTYHAARRVLD